MNPTTASANLQALKSGGAGRGSPRGTRQYYRDCWGHRKCAVRAGASGCRRAFGSTWRSYGRARFAGGCDRHPCGAAAAARPARSLLVDVRPHEEYQAGHIPGATNIPIRRTGRPARRLTGDRDIRRLLSWCLLRHGPDLGHRARRGAGGETASTTECSNGDWPDCRSTWCTGRAWGLIARGAEGKSTPEAAARTARCPA